MKSKIRIKTKSTYLFLILIISMQSYAQEIKIDMEKPNYNSTFYFGIGYNKVNLQKINNYLQVYDYPLISEGYTNFLFGGYYAPGKLVFGGEGLTFFPRKFTKGPNTIISKGGYGYIYLGYKVLENQKWLIIPRLGFGGGGMVFDINSVQSGLGNFLLNLGALVNYRIQNRLSIYSEIAYSNVFDYDLKMAIGNNVQNIQSNVGGPAFNIGLTYLY